MSDTAPTHEDTLANASREEIMSALIANMVIQQTNMAMMMLGRMAHPETGETFHDTEAARMFIDQLEMLEAKTKGNLTRQEEALLKQALTSLRMAFVEAADGASSGAPASAPRTEAQAQRPAQTPAPAEPAAAHAKTPAAPAPAEPAPEESRKKFSKKY